ncbi:MAG: MFS transporter [Thermoguttaceae bacterium]|jgi:MFS family permease
MVNPTSAAPLTNETSAQPWYRQLNGYHWLVLIVATMAWAFDCLSQQIFNLTRKPAMDALTDTAKKADFYGPLSTTALLVGWATGGIIFGILGDRIGRAKTLTIMIVCYSISTGLCGLSTGPWDYILYCFITGVGAGGIFPIACTLVAESLPDRTRPQALGMVQTFSALGNIGAGAISLGFVALLAAGAISTHWRWMFSVGVVPSLLAVIVARRLREPEAWKRAVAEGKAKKAGLGELFSDRRWRRNAIVGLLLAASGVVGLWGIGVFSNDLTQFIIGDRYDKQQCQVGEGQEDLRFVAMAIRSPDGFAAAKQKNITPRQLLGNDPKNKVKDAQRLYQAALDLDAKGATVTAESVVASLRDPDGKPLPTEETVSLAATLAAQPSGVSIEDHVNRIATRQRVRDITVLQWAAWTLICFNVGAFFGMYAFARVTQSIGRRPTFAIFFTIAMAATALAFGCMKEMPRDLWMVALMGGAQLSVFGGYAIYFPELFPTRLRSTGTSFCYNVGRYVAAIGPLSLAVLKPILVKQFGDPVLAFRYAGVTMCSCFLVGLVALLFAPETKGQPLPE